MITYGIMQGRLTPQKGRGIQFFPFDNWEQEFKVAKELELDEIEWIFDYDNYESNPLWTKSGQQKIKLAVKQTNIKVKSVCFDYFMRRPFYKQVEIEMNHLRRENLKIFTAVCESMNEVGADIIEIPIVDNSSIKSETESKQLVDFLNEICKIADKYRIMVALETDFPPLVFKEYLDNFQGEIYANYDSGNSSGLGYQAKEELQSLNKYVLNVHIKDRQFQGTTKELGTGSADFEQVFSNLKQIAYQGSLILQAARGEDGKETETISEQIAFVKKYVKKYALEL